MVMNKKTNGIRQGNENEKNKWTGNNIRDEGASKISETLKVNTTLTELRLSGDELEYNEKEKEMKMKVNKWTGNWIGDEGANKISESLKVNTTLTKLDLGGDE